MPQHDTPTAVIDAYFDAMRRGRDGEAELLALFHDDAEYTEPFAGEPRTHRGIDAIRDAIQASWEQSPPDLVLRVHRVDVDGAEVSSRWSCESPAFPAPVQGRDHYVVEQGRIRRLVTEIVE